MIATVVICIVIAVLGVFALRRAIRTFSGDGSCCGGKSRKRARKVRVADQDEAHYPYANDFMIGGMTCDKCVTAVESALNSCEGVWARVDLAGKTAHVLSKKPLDEQKVKDVVREAGYYVVVR